MLRVVLRALLGAVVGALAGVICVMAATGVSPGLVIEMDRDLPRQVMSGVYPPERAGDLTFVWTARRAELRLAGFSRRQDWSCTIRYRGTGSSTPRPTVEIDADGIPLERRPASVDFEDFRVTVPARGGREGLILGVTTSETFVPGSHDTRELGLQIDRIACESIASRFVMPPSSALSAAAAGGALFGTGFSFAGLSLAGVFLAVLGIAAGQAILLSTGFAPYGRFPQTMVWLAGSLAAIVVAAMRLLEWRKSNALSAAARFAMVFSAAAFYLKLLALLHPSKLIIDAVFHAHRLEWVLAGRYFFTQPLQSGVTFPYAVGLYLFATPWTWLTRDYVSLLRIIVCGSEVLAGLLLYPLIARVWGSRWTAALAVMLFNVVPLPYGLIGNGNQTNAFGQSVALMTLIALALPQARTAVGWAGLFALATLAFLTHISTFAQLFFTISTAAVLYWWFGDDTSRRAAPRILAVGVLAALLAVVTYYGHFGDVYRAALRARASSSAPASPAQPRVMTPVTDRVVDAASLTTRMIGWPILVLATVGAWSLWRAGAHDRLVLLIAAWGATFVTFAAAGVLSPVEAPLQRYAAEFVGRVNFATYPAAVVLAARGAVHGWNSGFVALRIVAGVLVVLSIVGGLSHWRGWIM